MKNIPFPLALILLALLPACETKTTNQSACGDGFVDPGEDCDGTVGELTCTSIGHYNALGTLRCNPNCTFDVTDCGGTCGDGTLDVEDGELCDTVDLGSATCASLGYYGGVLGCADDCLEYNEADCASAGRCGDGVLHAGNGELCDDDMLAGETCESQGFLGGTLACRTDCLAFDTSGCAGACGDGEIQTEGGEVCDGANLDAQTCLTLGYYGGDLSCAQNCLAFNLASCELAGRCGDDAIQISYGETCDGDNLGVETCLTQGFYSGTLACDTPTCSLDTTGCSGRCGDGVLQLANEQCDGSELDGETCVTLGYNPGPLACTGLCTFDISGCDGRCGDGIIQSSSEDCEGTNLGGRTCATIGFLFGGSLSCIAADCAFNWSACNTVSQVTGGGYHSCARLPSGALKCWGSNTFGQLGDGTATSTDNPINVSGLTNAAFVDAGTYHTCAVLTTGAVKCWGGNSSGQLGDGTLTNRSTPTTISGLTTARAISAGATHTCVVLTDDTVKCWGANNTGQLGDGTLIDKVSPVSVTGLTNVAAVAASWGGHTCAVRNDGTARCWGSNTNGQLGNDAIVSSSSPVVVSGLTGAAQITTGVTFSCARLTSGTVKCWGANTAGQVGDGTTTQRLVPTTVFNLTGVADISSGAAHTCAAFPASKDVRCWGGNTEGQIGDGTTDYRTAPVNLNLNSYANTFGLGHQHSCVIHRDWGSISCWGRNNQGQLGVGDLNTHRTPTPVVP